MELKSYAQSLIDTPRNITGTKILVNIIALFLIYRFATEILNADFIYSYDSTFSPKFAKPALFLTLLSSIAILAGRYVNLALIVSTFSFWYLCEVSITGDGGDNILKIILIYLIFIHSGIFTEELKPGLRTFLHNLAVFAIISQAMILYFVAGSVKMQGDMWTQGTAMYYVLSTNEFGPGMHFARELLKNPWVTSLLSHLTVVYQIAFPFMIYSRFHLFWALLGLGLHAAIAVTMGLFTFSLIMSGIILFTINDREWEKISGYQKALMDLMPKSFKKLLSNSITPTRMLNNNDDIVPSSGLDARSK